MPKGVYERPVKIEVSKDNPIPKNEVPPPTINGTEDKRPCSNCEINCEGKGQSRWHYGGPSKWCNKCKCLELKQ